MGGRLEVEKKSEQKLRTPNWEEMRKCRKEQRYNGRRNSKPEVTYEWRLSFGRENFYKVRSGPTLLT